MKKSIAVIFVLFLSFPFVLYGQSWKQLNTSLSSIPTDELNSIFIEEGGTKWISTNNGLLKYDGAVFTEYNTKNSGLKSDFVSCIVMDGNSHYWIGTYFDGLFFYDNSNWTHYTTSNSGLSDNRITCLLVQNNGPGFPDGAIWIGTYGNGLSKYDGVNWETFNNSGGHLPDQWVHSLTIENETGSTNAIVWVGTGNGLIKFDGAEWTNFSINGESDKWINTIAFEDGGISFANGKMWVGTEFGELYGFNGTSWEIYNLATAWNPNNSITDLEIDQRGRKWVGTDEEGLVLFDNTQFISFYKENSEMPGNNVIDLTLETANDSLYVWMIVYDIEEPLYMGITILSEEFINTDVNTECLPDKFALFQGYPNPFNPITTIGYELGKESQITIDIYNIAGQRITTLVNESKVPGKYSVVWDGKDEYGNTVSTGTYLYRLKAGNHIETKKVMFIK